MLKTVFGRAVGNQTSPEDSNLRSYTEQRSGDVEALVDAVGPAIRDAHRPVGSGVQNINIVIGGNVVQNFDYRTKEYIENQLRSDIIEELDVSIGSFNVSTGNGRAYLIDEGRTVPFSIHPDANPRTDAVLSYSLDQYARGQPSSVTIHYNPVRTPDRKLKKCLSSAHNCRIHEAFLSHGIEVLQNLFGYKRRLGGP